MFIRVNANGNYGVLQDHTNASFAGWLFRHKQRHCGGEFAIGAATGGENDTYWIHVEIATTPCLCR